MEELDGEAVLGVGEKRVIGVVGDLSPFLVVDLRGDLGGRDIRLAVRLFDEALRRLLERLEGEWPRFAEPKTRPRARRRRPVAA